MIEPKQFHRYDLAHILPIVVRRVLDGDFASQAEVGRCYGVDKDTAKRWRRKAVETGLTTNLAWQRGLVEGRLSRLGVDVLPPQQPCAA